MTPFLLTVMLAAGPDIQQAQAAGQTGGQPGAQVGAPGAGHAQQAATPRDLEGQWSVVYAEVGGHRIEGGQNATVTIHGNTLTFNQDGREHTLRLSFQGGDRLTG